MWFPNRSDTNRPVQSQKRARSLKFWSLVEEELYYPSSENKGADQLRGYREADLHLCFRLCKLLVFSRGGSFRLSAFFYGMRRKHHPRYFSGDCNGFQCSHSITNDNCDRSREQLCTNQHFCIHASLQCNDLPNCGHADNSDETKCMYEHEFQKIPSLCICMFESCIIFVKIHFNSIY